MRPFVVIDSETDPFLFGRIPQPFVWGLYDGSEFTVYTHETVHSLIKNLSEKNIIVYAHNGGKFDYHFLLPYLEAFDDVKIINGRLAQFRIGRAEFRDSMNILPVALKHMEIVDASGNVAKKQEFDYALMEESERYKPEVWEKIIDYLRDDCVTLYEAIAAFQGQYGRHLTQAGAAMAQWKKISGEIVPESDAEYFSKFADYYYGGRVQCFKQGIVDQDFSVFDINSAYPYAMLDRHAYGITYSEAGGEDLTRNRAQAFFHIRTTSHGAFPFRTKTGLEFPNDGETREFRITGWELIAAEETNTAGDYVVLGVIYHDNLKSFSEYIDLFYQRRMTAKATGDKAGDLFAKLLMNSLYGKFGSNPENYANFCILPPEELSNLIDPENDYQFSGELGCWLLAEKGLNDDEKRHYNVATAASITGYVRAFLWRAICKTGIDRVLYCDTDSIATTDEGNALDTGKSLGQWKHEGEFCKAGIAGKKLYIFKPKKGAEYKTASKGARLTHAELWKVAEGASVTYNPEAPTFSVHHKPKFISRKIRLTL
jgi:hypothetical protein